MSGIVPNGREEVEDKSHRKIVDDRIEFIKENVKKAERYVKLLKTELELLEVALKLFGDDSNEMEKLAETLNK